MKVKWRYVVLRFFVESKMALRRVCKLDVFTTYGSCLTLIRLTVVLCALHELNYNIKAIIVAIVI